MNRRSLRRYLPQIIVSFVVLLLITGIYIPLGYIGYHGQEARSKFFVALDQGALFWGTLTATFVFIVFGLIKAEKYLVSLLVSVLLVVSAMILYMSLSNLRPTHIDIAIYEGNEQQNLIIQYY